MVSINHWTKTHPKIPAWIENKSQYFRLKLSSKKQTNIHLQKNVFLTLCLQPLKKKFHKDLGFPLKLMFCQTFYTFARDKSKSVEETTKQGYQHPLWCHKWLIFRTAPTLSERDSNQKKQGLTFHITGESFIHFQREFFCKIWDLQWFRTCINGYILQNNFMESRTKERCILTKS